MTTVKAKYYEGIGRRKVAVARVRITLDDAKTFTINGKTLEQVFPSALSQERIMKPLVVAGMNGKFSVSVKANGGGMTGWADAISLGLARALVEFEAKLKPGLRKEGLMTRDPRAVERKKAGLKKARKAPRFSKR
ncbi:30S ribosomal protein S9 [Candidatus Dojkabacteria bacterium CG_4_9_14_3_um_filter_150_Dojkabacteria_WS6_41_13]|uniref:Small ribosomal subunit protein uS9 n=1 Tax=Candidatus Dojkabacteria bacterium CG_4_10_14_0_2_um_filter_Dojkabacteria_WS6_41_15 TaxID=2014249 RepID=A0A2M7W113_9BACT|nr:MAG: 30S ribosomal protein S9 [Candidatus Dojkabacteria bacterium CG_4_10_14_0_2_um_filter_Dojkabacteria_WS6_41_15]PJB22973.1 MAG: 30S ribosomal protein S9 [Candidatus Dojkabacteria bacterium CG_4_9_14_3_um_filter_150_Dojkabacteria_WS6_41_13]